MIKLHISIYRYNLNMYIYTYICKQVCTQLCLNVLTFKYNQYKSYLNHTHFTFQFSVDKRGSASSPDSSLQHCSHGRIRPPHGIRVSIPHTYTNTIGGGGTYSNLVRGAKMPFGSAFRSLSVRRSTLHTRAAGGKHKCLLLPVPACLRVLAGACLSIPIHPPSHTHTPSITNHK